MANKGFRRGMRKTESGIKSFGGSHLTFDAQEEIEKMTPSKAAEVFDAKETINDIKLKFKKAKKLSSEDINFLTTYYAENPEKLDKKAKVMLKDLSAILYSPEVSLKVAQILGHNKRFQAKAEKEPEIALKYAETVKKAKIKDIEKAIKRHFKKNPSEKEVEYLIKISSHPRVKEKRIINTIRSKKDFSLLKTYVNSNENANVELVNKMVAASVKRNSKKGYMMTAAYVNKNNKVVAQDIADLIYGNDEGIKDEEKEKKAKYLENVNNILLNIANAQKIAENVALEESEMNKITLQIVDPSKEETANLDSIDDATFYEENKEAVEMAREALYNDYIAKEREKSKQEIEGIRSQFPNEKSYSKYVDEIRKTKAYQKAYAKYKKMYAEAKQNLTKEAIGTVKNDMNTESKKDMLNKMPGSQQSTAKTQKSSSKSEEMEAVV